MKKAIGFNRDNREGADAEAIEKMFTPEPATASMR